jgi:hypothetical protein
MYASIFIVTSEIFCAGCARGGGDHMRMFIIHVQHVLHRQGSILVHGEQRQFRILAVPQNLGQVVAVARRATHHDLAPTMSTVATVRHRGRGCST